MTPRRPVARGKGGQQIPQAQRGSSTIGLQAAFGQAPAWLSGQPGQWVIAVRAQPGARRLEVLGEHGGALKVRIDAPAIEGRANEALLRWIAGRLGLRVAQVALIAGATSRDKRVLAQAPLGRVEIVERLLGERGS